MLMLLLKTELMVAMRCAGVCDLFGFGLGCCVLCFVVGCVSSVLWGALCRWFWLCWFVAVLGGFFPAVLLLVLFPGLGPVLIKAAF